MRLSNAFETQKNPIAYVTCDACDGETICDVELQFFSDFYKDLTFEVVCDIAPLEEDFELELEELVKDAIANNYPEFLEVFETVFADNLIYEIYEV